MFNNPGTLVLWGLVINYGEGDYKTANGGKGSFTRTKGAGAETRFSRTEGGGGGTESFEVVLSWELEVLAIVIGGGGAHKVYTL